MGNKILQPSLVERNKFFFRILLCLKKVATVELRNDGSHASRGEIFRALHCGSLYMTWQFYDKKYCQRSLGVFAAAAAAVCTRLWSGHASCRKLRTHQTSDLAGTQNPLSVRQDRSFFLPKLLSRPDAAAPARQPPSCVADKRHFWREWKTSFWRENLTLILCCCCRCCFSCHKEELQKACELLPPLMKWNEMMAQRQNGKTLKLLNPKKGHRKSEIKLFGVTHFQWSWWGNFCYIHKKFMASS